MKLRLEGGSGHANTIYFVALFKTIEWWKNRFFYLLFTKGQTFFANFTRWKYVPNFFLFGIYKSLNRNDYDGEVAKLLQANFIQEIHENTYVLTPTGKMQLHKWGSLCFSGAFAWFTLWWIRWNILEKIIINYSNHIKFTTE